MLSLVGVALLGYGRKQGRGPHIGAGLLLLVVPFFLRSTLLEVVFGVGVLGVLSLVSPLGYCASYRQRGDVPRTSALSGVTAGRVGHSTRQYSTRRADSTRHGEQDGMKAEDANGLVGSSKPTTED